MLREVGYATNETIESLEMSEKLLSKTFINYIVNG